MKVQRGKKGRKGSTKEEAIGKKKRNMYNVVFMEFNQTESGFENRCSWRKLVKLLG